MSGKSKLTTSYVYTYISIGYTGSICFAQADRVSGKCKGSLEDFMLDCVYMYMLYAFVLLMLCHSASGTTSKIMHEPLNSLRKLVGCQMNYGDPRCTRHTIIIPQKNMIPESQIWGFSLFKKMLLRTWYMPHKSRARQRATRPIALISSLWKWHWDEYTYISCNSWYTVAGMHGSINDTSWERLALFCPYFLLKH